MKNKANRKVGKSGASALRGRGPLLGTIAALLLCGSAGPAFAGSATWNGVSLGDWNTNFDWTPPTVPNGPADIATFSTSPMIGVSLSANTEVNSIVFASDSSVYTIFVNAPLQLTISGAGITNSSGTTQSFVIFTNSSSVGGAINFTNSATAGSGTIFFNQGVSLSGAGGSTTNFFNSASAGSGMFFNDGASVSGGFGGATRFNDSSSAGTGVFNNGGGTVSGGNGGSTEFRNSATAANGAFSNSGGNVSGAGGGATLFFAGTTAGNGIFMNFAGTTSGALAGVTQFFDASAGSGTFTSNGSSVSGVSGGVTEFFTGATGANGTFINVGGTVSGGSSGSTVFHDTSTAGSGNFTNFASSVSGAPGGFTMFQDSSTAGNGVFTNHPAQASGGGAGSTAFQNTSTAGSGTFTNNGAGIVGAAGGSTLFQNNATAGNGFFINNPAGVSGGNAGGTIFLDNSTAGAGTFTNNGSSVSGAEAGFTLFQGNSTVGNAVFINNPAGVSGGNAGGMTFQGTSTAGSGTFTNNGSAVSGAAGGFTIFQNTATAGNGIFTNNAAGVSGGNAGSTTFQNASTAGSGNFTNNGAAISGANPGETFFFSNSTAGNATFTNNGGAVSGHNGGDTKFFDNSTAGSGTFINNGGTVSGSGAGDTEFHNSSTAASGVFTNNGAAAAGANAGFTEFDDSATAGSGTFTNNGASVGGAAGGHTEFNNASTAGTGLFISNGSAVSSALAGGQTVFNDTSTAASATLIANGGTGGGSGGLIAFFNDSTGGTATVKVFGNGSLEISQHNSPGVTIGSIEGDGNVFLGGNNLTVGGNNLSTSFDGVMQDGGFGGGTGGSLTKIGTGALILNGDNTYTGATTVNAGALIVNGSIASAKTIINTGAAFAGNGTIGGDLTNNGLLAPGRVDTLNSSFFLAFSSGAASFNATLPPAQNLVLNVKGNYNQSATGTLVIAYGGSASNQHTSLNVQGQASLNGNLRLIQVNGAQLVANDQVPIVTATGGVTGQFTTVTDSALINATVVYQPNSVLLEFSQSSLADVLSGIPGISANDLAVARALDSAAGDPRAAHLFSILNADTLSQLARDIQLINPEQLTATSGVGTSVSSVHALNLQLRMEALRAGVTGFSSMGFHTAGNPTDYSSGLAGPSGPDGKSGKEVAPPPPDNRWGSFITGAGEFNHVGDTANARGFNLASGGITLGVDYRFTDHFVAGLFTGYTYTGIDLANRGRITADAGKVGLYSTYFNGGFYVDSAVQGGYSSYENRRTGLEGTAHSSPHGGDLNVLFAPGYNWTFGALTIGPTASFQYSYQSTNGFTETGSAAPMTVFSEHSESLVSSFGIKASYDWKIGSAVLRPEVRLGWEHEYGDVSIPITARLSSGAGDTFVVDGPAIGRDSMHVGAGVSMVWSDRLSTYLYYDGEFFKTNYDSSTVTGGFRILF